MAVAAAGGGLLITAASAAPAYASAAGIPTASHGGHKITITIHAHPRAHAASGIGPRDILPCAVKPGAKPADTCTGGNGDKTISCSITADKPFYSTGIGMVTAHAGVNCTDFVTRINLQQGLERDGVTAGTGSDIEPGTDFASSYADGACRSGTYVNIAQASITFPPGYIITAGTNPIHATSASFTIPFSGICPVSTGGGGGGGGGGGCAIHAPSLAGHPAGRHPDFVACE
jgi:hypothetical protein